MITLGALKKKTREYVCPIMANKEDEHVCIECNRDLVLCRGEIRVCHFRHRTETIKCCYYNGPTETQIHKDAKLLLKMIMDRKIPLSFIRKCTCCSKDEEFDIPEITECSSIEIEYRFDYNGLKIADVAYIDNGEIICIFEICHTHKTLNEHRPEPWFEIDAFTLLSIANEVSVKIPCIRCVKCEECCEKEKKKIANKNKAVDILYDWLKTGNEIYPFINKESEFFEFGKIEKNTKSGYGGIYDLIINNKDNDNDYYETYYIKLVYDYTQTSFTKEDAEIAENGTIAIYYVNINWILSQTETPTRIHYIAGVDCYSKDSIFIDCRKCNAHFAFYVKRINFHTENYKVINMGCSDCGHNSNTEFANCFRCKENTTPLCIMETNLHPLICKQCDVDLHGKTLLQVPFSEKEDIKDLGGRFDYLCKKWYVDDDNEMMDIILSHWEKAILGIINTKNPY